MVKLFGNCAPNQTTAIAIAVLMLSNLAIPNEAKSADSVVRFVDGSASFIETLNAACGLEIADETTVQVAHLNFRDIAKIDDDCIEFKDVQFCPTIIFERDGSACGPILYTSGYGGLCCTNRLRDSLCESSVIAGGHEQLVPYEVPDKELAFI